MALVRVDNLDTEMEIDSSLETIGAQVWPPVTARRIRADEHASGGYAFRGVDAPKLSAEVADDGQQIMMISIRQALAGPAEGHELVDEPVLTLVDRGHLNNLNQRFRAVLTSNSSRET